MAKNEGPMKMKEMEEPPKKKEQQKTMAIPPKEIEIIKKRDELVKLIEQLPKEKRLEYANSIRNTLEETENKMYHKDFLQNGVKDEGLRDIYEELRIGGERAEKAELAAHYHLKRGAFAQHVEKYLEKQGLSENSSEYKEIMKTVKDAGPADFRVFNQVPLDPDNRFDIPVITMQLFGNSTLNHVEEYKINFEYNRQSEEWVITSIKKNNWNWPKTN
ncbi:Uncharacterised protein [Candidatus Gugararchaeum adminiculabundum]|nr:Uncharacterised protein [Candidatus Gugararchaeum adminiculabundum]